MIFAEKREKLYIRIRNVDEITSQTSSFYRTTSMSFIIGWVFKKWKYYFGGLLLGISRKEAADFSFIMAVPLMFIACIYDLLKVVKFLQLSDFAILAIGFY